MKPTVIRIILLLFLVVITTTTGFFNYQGYKVYSIQPTADFQLQILKTYEGRDGFDFWSDIIISPQGKPVDVMVEPKHQEDFEHTLLANKMNYSYLHDDLEKLIENERILLQRAKAMRSDNDNIEFNQYYRFDEIQTYLNSLAINYPGVVTLEAIGASREGRELIAAKISSGPASTQKPIILIDGGIHAREWIAPITVQYILDQLVTNSSNDHLYRNVDWYILPVLNPDGYEYTFTNERLWRKSRSIGFLCWGVDLNRNYDFQWGTIGASTQECSETYRGPTPASDIETQVWSTFIEKYAENIKLYLSFHSYGKYFLFPWGYTHDPPANAAQQDAIARKAADAIASVFGTTYVVGQAANTLYPNSGSSRDWAHGAAGIPYSYTVELPENSFIVDPSNIPRIVGETFEGVKVFWEYIENQYGKV